MKKYIYSIIIGCSLVATSCADLDQDPNSFLTQKEWAQTEKDTATIAKSTSGLYKLIWHGNYGFNSRIMRINAGADDITTSPSKANNALTYIEDLNPSMTGNDADFSTTWLFLMNLLRGSNAIIEETPIPNDNTPKTIALKELVGEAYFMRGLAYFYTVRLFGGAPFFHINSEAEKDNSNLPRTNVETIYNESIIPDLIKASEWLPSISRTKNSATPSKWAAKACLTEAYMTMAGWPLNKGTQYYQKAATEALDVINNSGLILTPNYSDLWKEGLKTQANEHMFALHHSVAQKVASQYGKSFYPIDFSPLAGWADYYGNEAFFLKYPNDDRKAWNYMTEWPITKGGPLVNYKNTIDKLPCISKYYDYNDGPAGKSQLSNGITPIYRFADVLLMYAEADNLATGSVSSKALDCLNLVQSRSHSTLTTTTNSADFDKAVFDERGWEFVAEFKRWFDLVRREKLSDVKPTKWATSVYKANNHYYLPIPYIQIELTGWENNAGY